MTRNFEFRSRHKIRQRNLLDHEPLAICKEVDGKILFKFWGHILTKSFKKPFLKLGSVEGGTFPHCPPYGELAVS